MSVLEISSSQHPVKAGLSDAFMILNPSPDVPGESPGVPWSAQRAWTELRLTQTGLGRGWVLAVVEVAGWLIAEGH